MSRSEQWTSLRNLLGFTNFSQGELGKTPREGLETSCHWSDTKNTHLRQTLHKWRDESLCVCVISSACVSPVCVCVSVLDVTTLRFQLAAFTGASLKRLSGQQLNWQPTEDIGLKCNAMTTKPLGKLQIPRLVWNLRIRSSVEWLAVLVLQYGEEVTCGKTENWGPAVVSVMMGRSMKHHKAMAEA